MTLSQFPLFTYTIPQFHLAFRNSLKGRSISVTVISEYTIMFFVSSPSLAPAMQRLCTRVPVMFTDTNELRIPLDIDDGRI